MDKISLKPYIEKEKILRKKLLDVTLSVAKIKIPLGQVEDSKAQKYFSVLGKGVKNFSNFFGLSSNEEVFESLQKVIKSELITTIFIRNQCFAKIYRYLSKLDEVLENCSDLKNEIIKKAIDTSNIDTLIETFRVYTRDLLPKDDRYEYIKTHEGKELVMLYQSWIDSELFTALLEFHRADQDNVKNILLEKIKMEINESINKENYTLTKRIKDEGYLFWALFTVLSVLDNPENIKIMNLIQNVEDFKNVILIQFNKKNSDIRYPSIDDLKNESTIEIQGSYRTRLYRMQSVINIYNYFTKLKDTKYEKFLLKLDGHINSKMKKLLLSKECNRNSDNIYFLSVQMETLYKFLKMKRPEEKRPKTIKKKMLNRKEAEKEIEEENLEYEVWDIRGKKQVSQKKIEELKEDNKKSKLDILVDEDGTVYFKGNKVDELKKAQLLYDFLIYFLKNKGVGGVYKSLYFEVWPQGKKDKFNPNFEFDNSYKRRVIRMNNSLNTLLKKYNLEKIMYEYNKYKLPEDFEFYVIEKI